jgi:hypothetical protein
VTEYVLTVQDDIAREISQGLRLPLTGEQEQHLAKNYTMDPEAYRDYLKGRHWWNKGTEEGTAKALSTFRRRLQKMQATRRLIPAWPRTDRDPSGIQQARARVTPACSRVVLRRLREVIESIRLEDERA